MIMNRYILVFFVLLFVPIIANESFGYFGGDIIEKNSLSVNFESIQKTSDIITINELDQTEK